MCLRRKNLSVRQYAVLRCRVAGLRQAIATEAPAELGGEEFASRASAEIERILSLDKCAMEKERAALRLGLWCPESSNLPREASYTSGAWVPAFFRIWLRREGARLMGAAEAWDGLMRDPGEEVRPPTETSCTAQMAEGEVAQSTSPGRH